MILNIQTAPSSGSAALKAPACSPAPRAPTISALRTTPSCSTAGISLSVCLVTSTAPARYQAPIGPVCDWPFTEGVECRTSTPGPTQTSTTPTPTTDPGCITDDDCPEDQWCDVTVFPGECKPGCRDDSGCTATDCSSCEAHVCHDPDCCSDQDCSDLTDLVCSTCSTTNTCSLPECCLDTDCPAGFVCENELCVEEGECDAERPCEGANQICNADYSNCEYCDLEALQCKPGCDTDDNCEGSLACMPDHT